MRILMLLSVLGAFFVPALSASAQSHPPVRPDPWRGPRQAICVDFDRTKANVCNTNPNGYRYRTSTDCRDYHDNGGTVTVKCNEDHPNFYRLIRVAAVARTCGENGIDCIGAYFDREFERCAYRVVPDGYPKGRYDIWVSDLYNEWRIRIFLPNSAGARDYASKLKRQERYAFSNERNPYRYEDPCSSS